MNCDGRARFGNALFSACEFGILIGKIIRPAQIYVVM
jgi:hypothetical protein